MDLSENKLTLGERDGGNLSYDQGHHETFRDQSFSSVPREALAVMEPPSCAEVGQEGGCWKQIVWAFIRKPEEEAGQATAEQGCGEQLQLDGKTSSD